MFTTKFFFAVYTNQLAKNSNFTLDMNQPFSQIQQIGFNF